MRDSNNCLMKNIFYVNRETVEIKFIVTSPVRLPNEFQYQMIGKNRGNKTDLEFRKRFGRDYHS